MLLNANRHIPVGLQQLPPQLIRLKIRHGQILFQLPFYFSSFILLLLQLLLKNFPSAGPR
jgi:hypothetical protein